MKVSPKSWRSMNTAPHDGTPILACRNNGCGWDHMVVWWSGFDSCYPWRAEHTAYPEDRLDNWQPLTVPYSIQNYWG